MIELINLIYLITLESFVIYLMVKTTNLILIKKRIFIFLPFILAEISLCLISPFLIIGYINQEITTIIEFISMLILAIIIQKNDKL